MLGNHVQIVMEFHSVAAEIQLVCFYIQRKSTSIQIDAKIEIFLFNLLHTLHCFVMHKIKSRQRYVLHQ